ASGTGTWSLAFAASSFPSDGDYAVRVRAVDDAGNTQTPVSRSFTVDTVPPTATMDNPGPYLRGTINLTSTTGDAGGTGIASAAFEKSPAGAGTWTPVAASWNTTAGADGLYDLRVVAVDNAGNTTTSAAVTNVRVDNTAPSVTMDSPGAAVSGTVALSSTNDDGSGSGIDTVQFEYKSSSSSTWDAASPSWDTTLLTDGDYDLRAIVTDRAGNSTTSAPVTTNVDNVDPTVSFATPLAGGYVNAAAADPFTLVANANDVGSGVASVEFWTCDDDTVGCSSNSWTSLGTDATAPYEASWALPGTDGNRALRARATDNAGRQETAVVDVTIDRVVPETTLLTNPGNPSADASPMFTFESDEPGAVFECSVDGGVWSTCATPNTTVALADGTHTFEVRAVDLAGNVDATSASWTWLVDTTAPVATMDDPGANLRGTVGLSSSQSDPGGAAASGIANVVYQYSVADANTWVPVAAVPWDTTVPNDGLYDVRVVVTDNAGNETQSAAVEDRRIDNSPPVTAIDDPGANLRSTVTLTGSASDSGSGVAQVSFEYSVDGSSWTLLPGASDNSAPYEFAFDTTSLADGLYFFRTTATDIAGNAAVGAAVGPRRIDNTAPVAVMNDPGANLRGTVNLTSTADDPGGSGVATVVYGYTGPESGTTATTWATNGVADGSYDLTVTVTDVAGNVTVSNVVSGRRVDNTAPSTGHNAPGGWQSSGVTVSLSPSDGGSGVTNTQYAVDGGGWQSGTSVSVSGDGIHSISFFSTDAAGNVESPKTATVSIDTTPPSAGAMDPGNYLRGTVTLSASPDGGAPGAALVGVEFQHKRSSDSTWTSLGVDTDSPYSASWATSSADDGSWDLRFIARDDATPPNEDTVDMNSKIVDNTAPTGSVSSPLPGATVSGDVTLGVTANDDNPITSVEYYVNGGSVGSSSGTPYQVTWSSGSTSDGSKSIHAVITDMAGNSHTTAAVNVTSDNFAPTVSVAGLPANVSGAVTLQASASNDTVTVAYQARQLPSGGWSGVGSSAGGSPWAVGWTPPTDGGWEVRAIATDAGANSGTSVPVQTFVDNTAPTGLLTKPSDGDRVGGSAVALEATASDGGSGVASVAWQARQSGGGSFGTIASDTGAPFAATWDVTSLPSVAHDLQIVVTDAAGNTFTSPFSTVDVDSTAPTVTLNDPGAVVSGTIALSAATVGDAATVTFGISPAGAASWATIATDGAPPYGTNFDTTAQGDGVYDLRAVVSDSVGNTSTHVRPNVRIDNFMPVLVSSVPSNGAIVAGASSVVLNFSEAGTVSALELDGSAAPCVAPCSGTSVTVNSGALANGSHTVTGTVTDGAGNASSFTVSFVVGVPAASAEEPSLPVDPIGAVPMPTNFHGTIDADGTLTLAWTPAADADGTPLATILYIDGFPTQSMAPGEAEVNLGSFNAADLRTFAVAAVGPDGRASATSVRLRSTSLLAGKPLADAEAALVNRGFALGDVTGAGAVVVKPERPLMAALGSPVDLELGSPTAPQTRLAFSVVGSRRYAPPAQKAIGIRAKATRAAQVTTTLLSPKGQRVYRWRFGLKAGTSVVRLTMPPALRRAGVYSLVFTVASGRDTVKRTITLEVVGKGGPRTRKKPVEVVLAGSSGAKDDIAVDLADDGLRLLSAAGSDETFGITASSARNVEVVVVDVDRFGVGLVRDLRIVFPMVKIIALSNDPRRIAQAMRAGATIAVARSTPPKELARLITQVAKRR
ncbi:MAG TPA: Ig-like domain-containing protein, partial [Gaiellaceae bacterium]|nr:Ig-like domain-containing protein [Gaiellaceae bacterium]